MPAETYERLMEERLKLVARREGLDDDEQIVVKTEEIKEQIERIDLAILAGKPPDTHRQMLEISEGPLAEARRDWDAERIAQWEEFLGRAKVAHDKTWGAHPEPRAHRRHKRANC